MSKSIPNQFSQAREAEEIAQELIRDRPEHKHLCQNDVVIRWAFREVPEARAGRIVRFKVRKLGGITAYLSGVIAESFFAVEIYRQGFERRTTRNKRILIDLALRRMSSSIDDEGVLKLTIVRPDIEVQIAAVEANGLYSEEILELAEAMHPYMARRSDPAYRESAPPPSDENDDLYGARPDRYDDTKVTFTSGDGKSATTTLAGMREVQHRLSGRNGRVSRNG